MKRKITAFQRLLPLRSCAGSFAVLAALRLSVAPPWSEPRSEWPGCLELTSGSLGTDEAAFGSVTFMVVNLLATLQLGGRALSCVKGS